MRKFTIAVAAIATGALLVPAQAENSGGGPNKNGTQCYNYSTGNSREGRFGYWAGCPQTASTPVTTTRSQRRPRAASR